MFHLPITLNQCVNYLGTPKLSGQSCGLHVKDKDKDKDLFIGPQEFVVGYSKAPEQPQSSARLICHSHAMLWRGRGTNQPPYALLHRSSPRYALRHGRRRWWYVDGISQWNKRRNKFQEKMGSTCTVSMGACSWGAIDSRSRGLGFKSYCQSCVEMNFSFFDLNIFYWYPTK